VSPFSRPGANILVVDDDPTTRLIVGTLLLEAGYTVSLASDGVEAWRRLDETTPDLVISDVMMPGMDGYDFLDNLRKHPLYRRIPVILLTSLDAPEDLARGLELGADDYLSKPPKKEELLARVRGRLARPPEPAEELAGERRAEVLGAPALLRELEREVLRYRRGGRMGAFALLELSEWGRVGQLYGIRGEESLARQLSELLEQGQRPLELVGRGKGGRFLILMPNTLAVAARETLGGICRCMADHEFLVGSDHVRLTPIVGFTILDRETEAGEVERRARVALDHARDQLDLLPAFWTEEMEEIRHQKGVAARLEKEDSPSAPPKGSPWKKVRLPFQVLMTLVVGIGLPFLVYWLCGRFWIDITGAVYIGVVSILVATVVLIWIEGFLASRRADPPPATGSTPPASAIIAAYLPNEALTVVETVEKFLAQDYPGPLQVILAYNTPRDHPLERVLREMAVRDPRFLPLRVPNSTSKAQNVNAALAEVTGEIVGIFDADHHPDPGSFERAWGWISNGWDVVQGRCVIRNGDASWISRTVAVEFEQMYGVNHPGRARLHGFGIFGGSNGFWRTDILRSIRMRRFMLTEDIDSSMRTVEAGYRIRSDPYLISRELGPVTLKSLWNQRLRWAQGWFQVSLRWLGKGLLSPHLTLRQKVGLTHLLFWRETYSWTAIQIIPIVAYWYFFREDMSWMVPIFVLTTLFTLSSGPGGIIFTYRLAVPEIKKQRWWFFRYYFLIYLPYSEFKTLIARVAQIKEFMGEEDWRVTPRTPVR